MPAHPFETTLVKAVRPKKQPYVAFDRNRYSVPHTHVGRPLTLRAEATTVRVVDVPAAPLRNINQPDDLPPGLH